MSLFKKVPTLQISYFSLGIENINLFNIKTGEGRADFVKDFFKMTNTFIWSIYVLIILKKLIITFLYSLKYPVKIEILNFSLKTI